MRRVLFDNRCSSKCHFSCIFGVWSSRRRDNWLKNCDGFFESIGSERCAFVSNSILLKKHFTSCWLEA